MTIERVSPEHAHAGVFKHHLARYKFAKKFISGKNVLDVGCGTGYGSDLLCEQARRVIGVDIAAEAINFAREHYSRKNLVFQIMDCMDLHFADNYFDVLSAFEVIEHLRDPHAFLREIRRVLKAGGFAIISTPNKRFSALPGTPLFNPYHFCEFDLKEFTALLSSFFSEVELCGQKTSLLEYEVWHGNRLKRFLARLDFLGIHRLVPLRLYKQLCRLCSFAIEEDLTTDDYPICKERIEEAKVFIAVCRG